MNKHFKYILFNIIKLSAQDQYHGSESNPTTTDCFTAFLIHCQWTSIPTSQLSSPHALMQQSLPNVRIAFSPYQATLGVFSESLPCLGPHESDLSWSNYFSGCPSNSVFFYHHSGSNVDHPQSSRLRCCRSIKFPGITSYSLY